ncbi:phosphonate ABC transporter ATP-binding protein [Jeotgalibacillus sp. ET6]|uniref:phosphonate ABC transporter ATP-binding protein n=1 Tax=Jeotgalibacillus sp. ET6 TaxID=3037260 RepID=UPI00241850D7|nr:phosphonate ABC transporter ATP-binding protein [Jeotgalibacillus sp. ET6]MDG5472558.1 phosphonate ABC transporter ATP-binding protein [Jeotgalibacillus sp. ET6]
MVHLSIQQVGKTYDDGTEALSSVSFDVNKGEGVVLLGHNGSGKSTLFRCINGIENTSSGKILYNGQPIHDLSKKEIREVRKNIGMVFQQFHLVGNLSVFQNVLFGGLGKSPSSISVFGPFAKQEMRMKALECLDRVGLIHVSKKRADSLSGGQQQRVAIARMLMQEPELVLADEPIASLDPSAGKEVMDLLWSVVKERGMTVICTLHQPEIALQYAERIIGLHKGRFVLDQQTSQLDDTRFEWLYEKNLKNLSKEVISVD